MAQSNPENIREKMGTRISTLRRQNGLSQESLAAKAGIDRSYLAGIESGKRNATITSIEKIVIALEIELKDLFDF